MAAAFAAAPDVGSTGLPLTAAVGDVGACDFALGMSAGAVGLGEGGTERRDMMTMDVQDCPAASNLCTLAPVP